MKPTTLIISCEHAVNTIPDEYMYLFHEQEKDLLSHKAVDFRALDITKQLSQTLKCEYIQNEVSHLLIDCNQVTNHDYCFSEFT